MRIEELVEQIAAAVRIRVRPVSVSRGIAMHVLTFLSLYALFCLLGLPHFQLTSSTGTDILDLPDYLGVLARRWRAVLVLGLLGTVIGALAATPQYRVTSTFFVSLKVTPSQLTFADAVRTLQRVGATMLGGVLNMASTKGDKEHYSYVLLPPSERLTTLGPVLGPLSARADRWLARTAQAGSTACPCPCASVHRGQHVQWPDRSGDTRRRTPTIRV
ncbi:hypothetical protein [Streptomyces vastus]|uniref:PH domain-containing protein n=1 Tax=Streptomyces vastus TaxID=285451 RepID=A0ABP6CYQ0_9ACTN